MNVEFVEALNELCKTRRIKKELLLEAIEQGGGERLRRRRQTERLKPYVAAQVDVLPETFTLGDKKNYQGFYNRPLSPDLSYQCFVLASLKEPVDQVYPRPQA